MRKIGKRLFLCLTITCTLWCVFLLRDRNTLNRELIRMHVIANSDEAQDQNVKLLVRDAVLNSIQEDLAQLTDVDAAKAYLQENLPKLQRVANQTLEGLGIPEQAVVSFCKEVFPLRVYDTFRLPSGIYDTLKITIGSGEGRNWWCVTFPSLCIPTSTEAFADKAVSAGFSQELAETLSGDGGYHLRFFLLDLLGKAEAICFPK